MQNQSDDPRIGSGRNGSDGGTLSHWSGNNGNGTDAGSLEALGYTFLPVGVYTLVALLIFWTLRRRLARVYGPRSISGLRPASYAILLVFLSRGVCGELTVL